MYTLLVHEPDNGEVHADCVDQGQDDEVLNAGGGVIEDECVLEKRMEDGSGQVSAGGSGGERREK